MGFCKTGSQIWKIVTQWRQGDMELRILIEISIDFMASWNFYFFIMQITLLFKLNY